MAVLDVMWVIVTVLGLVFNHRFFTENGWFGIRLNSPGAPETSISVKGISLFVLVAVYVTWTVYVVRSWEMGKT